MIQQSGTPAKQTTPQVISRQALMVFWPATSTNCLKLGKTAGRLADLGRRTSANGHLDRRCSGAQGKGNQGLGRPRRRGHGIHPPEQGTSAPRN